MLCLACNNLNRNNAHFCNYCGHVLSNEQSVPIEVFIAYTYEDEKFCKEIEKQLTPLEKEKSINLWNTNKAQAGSDFSAENEKYLKIAQVILLLISADFLASDYHSRQMEEAMKRYQRGEAYIIPVLVRPSDWRQEAFGKSQVFPTNEVAVTLWPNQDAAFVEIVQNIQKVLRQINPTFQTHKEQWRERGNTYFREKHYQLALDTYEQALYINPDAAKWCNKADTLLMLERYQDAANAYSHAIQLDIDGTLNHIITDGILHFIELNHYENIIETFAQAISLGIQLKNHPENLLYLLLQAGKWTLLKNKEKAFDSLEQALQISPQTALDYYVKAILFLILGQEDQALDLTIQARLLPHQTFFEYLAEAFGLMIKHPEKALQFINESVIRMRPSSFLPYLAKITALMNLQRSTEAILVADQIFQLRSDSPLAYFLKVGLLCAANQGEEALILLNEIPKTDSNFILTSCLEFIILNQQDQYMKELEVTNRCIQRFPACAIAYVIKGEILLHRLKRYQEALIACNVAADLNPNLGIAHKYIGDIQKLRGKPKKAEQAYAKARALGYDI